MRAWASRRDGSGVPWVIPVPEGTLLRGELPPGASRAEVRAPVAPSRMSVTDGEFEALIPVAVLPELVFYVGRDENGAIVPWPVEGEQSREPIDDADAACPACDGRAWDLVKRTGERAVVCHRCGWNEGWAETRRRALPDADYDEPEPPLPEDPTIQDAVAAAGFPVYGLAALTTESFSYGWREDGTITNIGFSYEQLGVQLRSTTGEPWTSSGEVASHALRNALERDVHVEMRGVELSPDAERLLLLERTRAIRTRIAETSVTDVDVPVDGHQTSFARVRDSGIEAAAADLGGVIVKIVSRKRPIAELALERLG